MNYAMNTMKKISLKSSFVFIGMLLFAFSLNVPSAKAYTDQEIADALQACINAGMTPADIAAAASNIGITAAMIDQAAADLAAKGTIQATAADLTAFSATVADAYAGVVSITAPNPQQLTTTQVSTVLSDAAAAASSPGADPTAVYTQAAATLANGGVSAADVIAQYHITDPATIANINAAFANQTVVQLQGTTFYTTVDTTKPTNIYGKNPDGSVAIVATFDVASGNVVIPDSKGGSTTVNIADAKGVSVCAQASSTSLQTCTTMDGHSLGYQYGMISAGYGFSKALDARNQALLTGDTAAAVAAQTAMDAAVALANATVTAESGGTQTTITVIQSSNGTLSYGCINSQNTTLSCPPGTSLSFAGLCVAPTAASSSGIPASGSNVPGSATTGGEPATGTAPATSFTVTSSGACFKGFAYDPKTNPPCVPCANGINGNTGCGGTGGDAATPLGKLYCLNGAINPIDCNKFVSAQSNAPAVTLTATPSSIISGQSAKLTWTSVNTNTCAATNEFGIGYTGTATTNGAGVSVSPIMTSTYQITCTGTGGSSAFSNATVTVLNPSASVSLEGGRVERGSSMKITWNIIDVPSGCTITKNGTPWKTGLVSPGSVNDTINGRTVYTINCPSVAPQSATVNVVTPLKEF